MFIYVNDPEAIPTGSGTCDAADLALLDGARLYSQGESNSGGVAARLSGSIRFFYYHYLYCGSFTRLGVLVRNPCAGAGCPTVEIRKQHWAHPQLVNDGVTDTRGQRASAAVLREFFDSPEVPSDSSGTLWVRLAPGERAFLEYVDLTAPADFAVQMGQFYASGPISFHLITWNPGAHGDYLPDDFYTSFPAYVALGAGGTRRGLLPHSVRSVTINIDVGEGVRGIRLGNASSCALPDEFEAGYDWTSGTSWSRLDGNFHIEYQLTLRFNNSGPARTARMVLGPGASVTPSGCPGVPSFTYTARLGGDISRSGSGIAYGSFWSFPTTMTVPSGTTDILVTTTHQGGDCAPTELWFIPE